MSQDSLRGLVQLVAGLGEMTVARANQAALDLVNLTGLENQLGKKKLARQVQSVTQEILKTAEANRTQVAALVRAEVESALARADVARVVDVDAARATTAALFGQVEDLTSRLLALVPGLSGSTTEATAAPPVPVPEAPTPKAAAARRRPARRSLPAGGGTTSGLEAVAAVRAPARAQRARKVAGSATATKRTAKQAPPKKVVAKKAPVEKAPARQATTKQATTKQATTKQASVEKAPVKKAPVEKAPVKKAPVKKAPVKKAASS